MAAHENNKQTAEHAIPLGRAGAGSALASGPSGTPVSVFIAITALAIFIVWGGHRVMPWDRMFPDYICYWSAGEILAAGQSPYDVALQTRVQQGHGWDRATDGFGLYDFLPFYYPPWFGLLWAVALPLGYEGGKIAWFFVNVELTLVTALLLKGLLGRASGWTAPMLVPCFLFSVMAVALGQTTILVFFLIVLAWTLLAHRWDRCAGVALAWLTIKPQLTVILLGAVLLWLLVRRRWQVLLGFGLTVALLCLVSTLLLPGWLPQMLRAPGQTPSPTEHYPWIGNTWLLVLRAAGLNGSLLWALYGIVAIGLLALVLRTVLARCSELVDVLGISLLAAFFVAPYARHYDFPILLVPVLLCLGPVRPLWRAVLLALLGVVPWLQLVVLARIKSVTVPPAHFMVECSYFWIPALGLLAWLAFGSGVGRGVQLRQAEPMGVEPARLGANCGPAGNGCS